MTRRGVGLALVLLGSLACGDPASKGGTSETETSTTGDATSTDTDESDESTETGATPDLPDPVIAPDPLVVLTFNVLCSFCDDTYDPWDDRVGYTADTIERHDPDVFGLQELFTADEVAQIHALIPEYDVIYFSNDTSDYADATVWWRADRYSLVESGFYWLSPNPDMPFSVGFAPPQIPRLVAWARLLETATGAEFLFASTHFDNNSPSQELSAPLLLERTVAAAGDLPIIVVGDFNSKPDSTAYGILAESLTNSFDLAETWTVESNEDPAPDYDPGVRIDHLWVAGGEWSVPWWKVDTWIYGESMQYTSDHFAMATELHFEGS